MIKMKFASLLKFPNGALAALVAIREHVARHVLYMEITRPPQLNTYENLPVPQDPWAQPTWDEVTVFMPRVLVGAATYDAWTDEYTSVK